MKEIIYLKDSKAFTKIKSFCASKYTIKKVRGQAINWKTTYESYIKMCLYLQYLNKNNKNKNKKVHFQKWAVVSILFSEEKHKNTNDN